MQLFDLTWSKSNYQLRFTLARGANPGTDQALAEDWVAGSRNFATKLWNATRFAMLNGANVDGQLPKSKELGAIDNWILTRLDQTIASADELFEKFEFAKACELIYHFAWDDLCDWYLELSKSTFNAGGADCDLGGYGPILNRSLTRVRNAFRPKQFLS